MLPRLLLILILGKLSSCRRDPLIKPGPGGRAVIDPSWPEKAPTNIDNEQFGYHR